jgi:hypothetical protein
VMLIVAMPLFGAVFPSLLDQSNHQLDTVLRAMRPAASPVPSPGPTPLPRLSP